MLRASRQGVKVGYVDKATSAHGLAAVLGECPSVGISGLTLGGGLGRLMGQHGSLCDNLLAAEVVTAEGAVRRVRAEENEDLYWAIRGGGGNFGIATNFRISPPSCTPGLIGNAEIPSIRGSSTAPIPAGVHGECA